MHVLEPGTTLSHYRIVGKLGQGGQAATYRAEDQRLNRSVVVKILRPELAASDAARRRFEREACLCSALDNPNIAAVYDVGEAEGLHYIVMQYVEGQTLRGLLAPRKPLEVTSALSLAIQIADALSVAHAAGIVHRDIKPSNIIITPAGQAKVLDFGLAKMLAHEQAEGVDEDDPLTETGVPYGSLGYGSPEQAMGERVDHRSDVFSVGVVLYEMVGGRPPFRGKHRIDVLHAVINQDALPLTSLNAAAPPELEAIVRRAMAKDPKHRFQTMAALRDELKALMRRVSQETGVVPTEASATLLVPQRARNPWLLSGPLGRVFHRLRGGRAESARPERSALPDGATPSALTASRPPDSRTPSDPGARRPARPPGWGTETRKTLAVLPFRNLAGDPAAAFYEFALAEALITELAQLRSLIVRPSSYIAPYAGQDVDPAQVGEELAVRYVLLGSFVKAPDRLRVNAQVVAAATGEIVWSDKVDVPAADLLAIQDTLAARVLAGLRVSLSEEEQERLDRLPTRSAEAYEFYLRGRDVLNRYLSQTLDVADLERAVAHFNEAAGLDPGFAAAHGALARCYVQHAQGYGGEEYFRQAERALRRALELDPALLEARLYTVYVDLHNGDKEHARATVEQLHREAPHDHEVLLTAAMLCRLDGLYERAMEHYDALLALSPRDALLVTYSRARVHIHRGEYGQAIFELEAARSAEPEHALVKLFLALAQFLRGRPEEAEGLLADVLRLHPGFDAVRPLLAWVRAARGQGAEAEDLLDPRVEDIAAADHDLAYWMACFRATMGHTDEALRWLQRAVRLGNEDYPALAGSPGLLGLHDDPRYQELMADLRRRWEQRLHPPA